MCAYTSLSSMRIRIYDTNEPATFIVHCRASLEAWCVKQQDEHGGESREVFYDNAALHKRSLRPLQFCERARIYRTIVLPLYFSQGAASAIWIRQEVKGKKGLALEFVDGIAREIFRREYLFSPREASILGTLAKLTSYV